MHCKIKRKIRDLVFDHASGSGVKVGDRLFCTTEPDNKHSDNAVVVK